MTLLLLTSTLLMTTPYLFTRLRHPLAMGLMLIFQTLLVCISLGMLSKSMWFSYILFLIFLGATLVLFIYVASLASNEMFKLSYPMMALIITPLLLTPPLLLKDELILPIMATGELSTICASEILCDPPLSLSLIYNPSSSFLTSFVILYLLLTLIVIVKLTASFSGPLRLS